MYIMVGIWNVMQWILDCRHAYKKLVSPDICTVNTLHYGEMYASQQVTKTDRLSLLIDGTWAEFCIGHRQTMPLPYEMQRWLPYRTQLKSVSHEFLVTLQSPCAVPWTFPPLRPGEAVLGLPRIWSQWTWRWKIQGDSFLSVFFFLNSFSLWKLFIPSVTHHNEDHNNGWPHRLCSNMSCKIKSVGIIMERDRNWHVVSCFRQVSIMAALPCRYICWQRQSLDYLFGKNPYLATVMGHLLGRDITNKLYLLNDKVCVELL